jgi:Domain of unknown function (DUF5134)
MGGPVWLSGVFAALMLTVAAYCAARLVAARRWRRPSAVDSDGVHVVMGVAMAGMLMSGLRSLPTGIWEGVFAVAAGWFGWRMIQTRRASTGPWRCPHPLPHLVECGAMLYMFLALPAAVAIGSGASGSGMGAMGTPATGSVLALVLALFMLGYVAWVSDGLRLRIPQLALAPAPQDALALAASAPSPLSSSAPPRPEATATATATASDPEDLPGRPYLAPRCAALCKVAMGLTMGYMLIGML